MNWREYFPRESSTAIQQPEFQQFALTIVMVPPISEQVCVSDASSEDDLDATSCVSAD